MANVEAMGMRKHGRSGYSCNSSHFTGKQKTGTKRKQQLTKRQKNAKRRSHVNKYAHLVLK
jgi:hypothetical protein